MSRYRVTSFRYTPQAVDMYTIVDEIEVATEAEALKLMHANRVCFGCWPDVVRLKDGAFWSLDTRRFEPPVDEYKGRDRVAA